MYRGDGFMEHEGSHKCAIVCREVSLETVQVFFFSSRRRHTRYWRDWSSDVCSSDLSGPPGREHYNNLHEQGGNLISCDGHAEYKKNKQTSSLDFGLVNAKGLDSPWQPTEADSRDRKSVV